jgi:putative YhdH/YhfP family quinone oxidoreductase
MSDPTFRAMIVEETGSKQFVRRIGQKTVSDLPDGEVLIKVHYSSLNYKDALSATGNKGVTRNYPHTPGIDAAGEVAHSTSPLFKEGDAVLVTGYDLGMNTAGGFGGYVRVPAQWVVPIPRALTAKACMVYGTAGFTAALCVSKLEAGGLTPESGEILVTGASGGVGSLAVALLARAGYGVLAASGKPDAAPLLTALGAKKILSREEVLDTSPKPLLPQRWAGAVDTVGGQVLTTVLRKTDKHGVIACCGNVASAEINMTVYPFILRGISLMGADSATSTMETRKILWSKLAGEWKIDDELMERLSYEVGLDALEPQIELILKSQVKGRCIVNLEKG